jgi:hypothetical protein
VPTPTVTSLSAAPPIARRARAGGVPGSLRHTGDTAPVRRVPLPAPPAPTPAPAPTTPVSDLCLRGRHHRCRSTVLLPEPVNGKRYGPCGCTEPDCDHGSPRR